jgi:hypothetical protein
MFPALSKHQMGPLCHFSLSRLALLSTHLPPIEIQKPPTINTLNKKRRVTKRPAFPLSESVYISLCFLSLRFSSSLLHISSLYIRSHLYSMSWKEETGDQTLRHATHEYSVFPQPIVLHTAYSTHLPYPVTFKIFISKVMFCVTFRKRFLVR